jgi:DNA-directed RNA polymerase specialized sigma subunit
MEAIQKSLSDKILNLMASQRRDLSIKEASTLLGVCENRVGVTMRDLETSGQLVFTEKCTYYREGYDTESLTIEEKREIAKKYIFEKHDLETEREKLKERNRAIGIELADLSDTKIGQKSGLNKSTVVRMRRGA